MGVHGLWQLLQPTGQPVSLESLSGKILAVDVSMWLHQSSKGMRDRHGNPLPNAHIIVLFRRICKLLFYHIKPVFVFDGGAPMLKRQVLVSRRQHREEAVASSNRSSKKLMSKLLKYHAIGNTVGNSCATDGAASTSNAATAKTKPASDQPDIFQLPPMPSAENKTEDAEHSEGAKEGELSWDERLQRRMLYYNELKEMHKTNVESEDFEALPADIKHEILTELKDAGRKTDWACINSMPKDSNDFSTFQLDRLVKQSRLSQRLESVRQEMNYSASGVDDIAENADGATVEANRVISDDLTHYVLIKGHIAEEPDTIAPVDEDIAPPSENPVPDSSSSSKAGQHRINDNFIIRKVVKDKNAGRKFAAPAAVVNLSSSGSSSDEDNHVVVKKPAKKLTAKPLSSDEDEQIVKKPAKKSAAKALLSGSSSEEDSKTVGQNTSRVSSAEPISCVKETSDVGDMDKSEVKQESVELSAEADDGQKKPKMEEDISLVGSSEIPSNKISCSKDGMLEEVSRVEKLHEMKHEDGDESIKSSSVLKDETVTCNVQSAGKLLDSTSLQPVVSAEDNTHADQPSSPNVKVNAETGEMCYEPVQEHSVISIKFDPARIDDVDELFPASIFVPSSSAIEESDQSSFSQEVTGGKTWNMQIENWSAVGERGFGQADDEEIVNPFAGMTKQGLVSMQKDLESETKQLQMERGKQERLATTITNQMQADAQELLRLFGVPFVVSPMEAEAQCAYLDLTDQTHGTATDDSDVWLFGGRRVYKNLFNQDRDVELYQLDNIQSELLLDRPMFINIALLCGSDYTEGIPGIGPVTALEIMAEFPGDGFEKLKAFADWWKQAHLSQRPPPVETKLKSRLRQLKLRDGFPSRTVFEAYIQPTIDDSKEPFTWGAPDVAGLREYARVKFGWGQGQTDELLLPLMKQLSKTDVQVQPQLTNYFKAEARQCKSKRLKRVINRLRSANDGSDSHSSSDDDIGAIKRRYTLRGKAEKQKSKDAEKSCSSTQEGGFVRKRCTARVIVSDESSHDSDDMADDDISDGELAQIDLDSLADV